MRRTKIVCTIGPASRSKTTLEKMIKAGMNIARLNFSHGEYKEHQQLIKNIRDVSKKYDNPVAVMQDLQGPKIRVGNLPKEGVELKNKSEIILTTNLKSKNTEKIPVAYQYLHKDVKPRDRILMDDGLFELVVKKVDGRDIYCQVINGGLLISHKGINLPDTSVRISAITPKDIEDLEFGIKNKVDFVALSFVRTAKEVYDLKYLIKKFERKYNKQKNYPTTRIIVKIEKPEAVENFDEILEATDGVMVARGDLGIEMPAPKVPLIQKEIIEKCLELGKPVIVATQMLDSMIRNPRPTRAEVSDVANAVIDHTDAVMLSGESAFGKYPVESVATMSKIINETEKSRFDDLEFRKEISNILPVDDAISSSARLLASKVKSKLILVASITGYTARIVSRYRPELNILATTDSEKVRRQLNLSWGVIPFVLPACKTIEELVDRSIGYIKKKKFVKTGDNIIIIAGQPVGRSGNVNFVEIYKV